MLSRNGFAFRKWSPRPSPPALFSSKSCAAAVSSVGVLVFVVWRPPRQLCGGGPQTNRSSPPVRQGPPPFLPACTARVTEEKARGGGSSAGRPKSPRFPHDPRVLCIVRRARRLAWVYQPPFSRIARCVFHVEAVCRSRCRCDDEPATSAWMRIVPRERFHAAFPFDCGLGSGER